MKAKRLYTMAIVLSMVLWMMPVEVFATEEMRDECICSVSCSEQDVNENCEVCSENFRKCEKSKQRLAVSAEEEKTSAITTEEKEESTTKATTKITTEEQEVTTKATTGEQEATTKKTTRVTTEKQEMTTEEREVTTRMTTERQRATTKTTTEEQEVTTRATTEKEEIIAESTTEKEEPEEDTKEDEGDSNNTEEIGIAVNETNFPDEIFRNYIIEEISDGGILTAEDIEKTTSMDVSNKGIESLAGIKQFKNLETLNCSNNKLKTLDLAGLESLKTVNADGQDGGVVTVVEEENGWKLDMEKIVGEDNLKNVVIAKDNLPEDSEYEFGVVVLSSVPETLTYSYKTGANEEMEVILTLDKKALAPELNKTEFDFGKTCIDDKADKQILEIKNRSGESIKFEIVDTDENSSYNINTTEGTIEAKSTVEVEIEPKEGLKVGEYKESFNVKVNGKEAETFSASFEVVEHDLVWKVDKEPTFTEPGYGHYECSACEYKGERINIGVSINVSETNFPDEAFRNWIIKNISGAEDKVLTAKEIEAVKSIEVLNQGIKNLEGIKLFKNLEILDCSNNNLRVLDLTGMTALETVNADGQKATATAVEEKDGWKLDMKEVVGEANTQNVVFADDALPKGAEYKNGIVTFATKPEIQTLTYVYKTGAGENMEVTLTLAKRALPQVDSGFKITLTKDEFDFGKKCIGMTPSEQSFRIKNSSGKSVKFQVVSKSQNSNYNITLEGLKNGNNLENDTIVTVKIQPKSGLKAGTYKETFSIRVNEKEAETFSASFQVIEHSKKQTWSSDGNNHWHECTNCDTKFDTAVHSLTWKVDRQATATQNGSGHYECSVCGYKRSSMAIAATGTTSTRTVSTVRTTTAATTRTVSTVRTTTAATARTVSTVKTTTATTRAGLLSKIIPTTGDNSHIVLWLGVLVICGVTILGALGRYLSKKK